LFSNIRGRSTVLGVIAAGGLAVDAYIHFDLASNYDVVKTSTLSQGELFRVEAVLAIVTALGVLIRPRRYTALAALAVAGSALAVLLVYRYYNLGAIGPVPSMYEPVWFAEKTTAAVAELLSAIASAALAVLLLRVPTAARRSATSR